MRPPSAGTTTSAYRRVWRLAAEIPPGRVATYGQLARLAGCTARQAGWAMAALAAGSGVPWHRVINAKGEIAKRAQGGGEARQKRLLRAEGVRFGAHGRVDLKEFGWPGPGWAWLAAHGFDPEDEAVG